MEGYFEDIWIMSADDPGTVRISYTNFGKTGTGLKFVGHPNRNKNLLLQNIGTDVYFALHSRNAGDILFRNFKVDGAAMGVQHVIYPEEESSYTIDHVNLVIDNVEISNVDQEGIYVGSHIGSLIQHNAIIKNCVLTDIGRDGIQTRSGRFKIFNNTGTNIGTNGEDPHGHGILIGTSGGSTLYSERSIISGNTFTNVHYYGIFVNGFGYVDIENNTIQSGNNAINTKNYESDTEDLLSIGFQTLMIKGNNLTGSPNAIDIRRDPAKCPVTVNLYGDNTLTGSQYIETSNGIVLNNL
jgi:hypothetical protein